MIGGAFGKPAVRRAPVRLSKKAGPTRAVQASAPSRLWRDSRSSPSGSTSSVTRPNGSAGLCSLPASYQTCANASPRSGDGQVVAAAGVAALGGLHDEVDLAEVPAVGRAPFEGAVLG